MENSSRLVTHYEFIIKYHTEYGITPQDYSGITNSGLKEAALPILSHPGATFIGWYKTETFDEGTEVKIGDIFTSADTQHFYAKWEFPPCVVNADSITKIAKAIREKNGTDEKLKFPDGFVSAINDLNKVETCLIDLSGLYDGVIGFMTVDEDGKPKYVVEDFYDTKYKEPVPIVKNSFMYIFHLNANYNHHFSDTITILREGPDNYNGLLSKAYIYGIHGDGFIYFKKTGSYGEK